MDHFEFAANQIRRSLASIENIPHMKLVVASETTECVDSLEQELRQNPANTKSQISMLIKTDQLKDELMALALPASAWTLWRAFLAHRTQKEADVSAEQFENAANQRDKQEASLIEMRNLLGEKQIIITSRHLRAALTNLGFELIDSPS